MGTACKNSNTRRNCHSTIETKKYSNGKAQNGNDFLIDDALIQEARELMVKDPENALRVAQAAEKRSPNNPRVLGTITQCLLNLHRQEEAKEYALRNIQCLKNAISLILLAKVYYALGNFEEAGKCAIRSIYEEAHPASLKFLANVLRRMGKYEEALQELDKIESRHPGIEATKGYCYLKLRKHNQAFKSFQKAEDRCKDKNGSMFDARIWIYAGYVFLFQDAQENLPAGLAGKIKNIAEWLLQQKPPEMSSFQRKDYFAAIEIVSEYVEQGLIKLSEIPTTAIRFILGGAKNFLGTDPQKALDLTCRAQRFDEDNHYILGIKIKCLIALERYDEAIEVAEQKLDMARTPRQIEYAKNELRIAQMAKSQPRVQEVIGIIRQAQAERNPQKAMLLINQADRILPNDPFVLAEKAKCLIRMHNFPEALEVAQQNARTENNSESYGLLTSILMRMRKYHDALRYAEKTIDRSDSERSLSIGYSYLVQILIQMKRMDEALEAAKEGIMVCENPINYNHLAIVYLIMDNLPEAECAAQKACHLNTHPTSLGILADAYIRQKKYLAAQQILNPLAKKNDFVQINLVICDIGNGKLRDAYNNIQRIEAKLKCRRSIGFAIQLRLYYAYLLLYEQCCVVKQTAILSSLEPIVEQGARWISNIEKRGITGDNNYAYYQAMRIIQKFVSY